MNCPHALVTEGRCHDCHGEPQPERSSRCIGCDSAIDLAAAPARPVWAKVSVGFPGSLGYRELFVRGGWLCTGCARDYRL